MSYIEPAFGVKYINGMRFRNRQRLKKGRDLNTDILLKHGKM